MPDPAESLRRARSAALEPWFAAPRDERGVGGPIDVLEIGSASWASSFDPETSRLVTIGADASARIPGQRFDAFGEDLTLPYADESFDLAFGVDALQRRPGSEKRKLMSEMWRVTRPGGRLLFLEDFVSANGATPERQVSAREFEGLIFEATAARVVLEHVEAIRYPGEDMHRAGVISLTRLGGVSESKGGAAAADGEGPRLVWEEPADGAEIMPGTVISGWAHSPSGIREVMIWLNGRRLGPAQKGLERPDVAAAHPGALRSGFRYGLQTVAVPKRPPMAELTVVVEDEAGRRAELQRTVRPVVPVGRPSPMSGSLDIPKWRDEGDPLKEQGWASPLPVHGWATDPLGIQRIDVYMDGELVGQAEHGFPREDVEMSRPDLRRLGLAKGAGWWAVIPTAGFEPGKHTLDATVHGGSGSIDLRSREFFLRADDVRGEPARRNRLEAILRCPKCHAKVVRRGETLVCEGCGEEIRRNEFGSLLVDEAYSGLDWRQAGSTNHGYEREAVKVIQECQDGMVLDIGAGLRENLPHVFQLDALAFPNVDVVADAAALPFADESFDGVVASNLLEHVPVPERVIREMSRVCKVGGRIYADWTSVHPYHGFPHHYSNATVSGMEWMMREAGGAVGRVEAADSRVTILLVLTAWLASLEDDDVRARVSGMSTGELMKLLREPDLDPQLYAALNNVFAGGRRLVPPKVLFTGTRRR